MFVILPNKVNGYLQLVPKLRNITLKSLYHSGSMKNVHLYLPKFKVETDISLSYWLPEVSVILSKKLFHKAASAKSY